MADENQESGLHFDLPKNRSSVIKVIGVGGGGSNAVNHMKAMGIKGVDFMVCNTDAQALEHSIIENRIQLGANLTEGLGAGANPDVGRDAAKESLEEIREVLKNNTRMVFITAGMGGGTGTGAAPVIAKLAREMNILTVGIVTKPFHFEGKVRARQAQEGIDQLRQHVDSLVVINNDKLREVYGNLSFRSGFAKADEVLATAAKGIAEVITYHYTTNIDLRDVRTVLENSGTAIMGSSFAKGTDRAKLAVTQALDSPLLNDNHINGAKNVLLLIVSGTGDQEITMDEMGFINEHIQDEAGGNANVILGVGIDEKLENAISVTVIATGFPSKQNDALSGKVDAKIVHPLDPDQPIVQDVFNKQIAPIQSPERRVRIDRPAQPDLFSTFSLDEPKVHDLYEEDVDVEIELQAVAEELVSTAVEMPTSTLETFETLAETETETEEAEAEVEVDMLEDEEEEMLVFNAEEEENEEDEEDDFEFTLNDDEVASAAAIFSTPLGENEVSFDLDDIKGEGIVLVTPTAKAPETNNKEVEYDPFDFRIDEVMANGNATPAAKTEPETEPIAEVEIPTAKVEEPKIIKHTLEDFRELEQRLQIKKPVKAEEPQKVETPVFKLHKEEKEDEDLLKFEVKQAEPTTSRQEKIADIDAFNNPLGPNSLKKIMERKERLEQFAYKFKPRIDEMLEREPAYKRQGLDLGTGNYSTNTSIGKMTLSGEGAETEIKSNNSFLHDNVD